MKLLISLLVLFLHINSTYGQWDEEQDYVRHLAETMPLKSIEVYLNGNFCRTYNYDFYRHYLGYTQYSASKKTAGPLRQYDDNGFLTEESFISENGSETNMFYRYDSLGNQVQQEECSSISMLDTTGGKAVRRLMSKCYVHEYTFNEDRQPSKEIALVDSVRYVVKAFEYEAGKLKKTIYFAQGQPLYEEVLDYTYTGEKANLWLQKGTQRMLKTTWQYDDVGRLSVILHNSVQYGAPHFNAKPEEATLLDAHIESSSKFKYDKQGRVSEQACFVNGKPGFRLTYKYKTPDK